MFLPRIYSHHSLLSALPQIPKLIADAKAKGYTTVCLADEDTGSGLIEFLEECKKQEISPALGVTLRVPNLNKQASFGNQKEFAKVVLIAKNEAGYKRILELISLARTVKEQPNYHIDWEDLQTEATQNMLVLIPTIDSEIYPFLENEKWDLVESTLTNYQKLLPNDTVLVELITPKVEQTYQQILTLNQKLAQICEQLNFTPVASPASRYLDKTEEEAFRVILAIRNQVRLSDITLFRDYSLPSVQTLQENFAGLEKYLDTAKIEEQIQATTRTDYGNHADEAFFPKVELPNGQNYATTLAWESYLGLISKFHPEQKTKDQWQQIYPYEKLDELKKYVLEFKIDPQVLLSYPAIYWEKTDMQAYVKQIEYELEIIQLKGYSSYFLILADIASFCRNNGIIASARGSGAGSLVGFLNNISTPDTIFYQIPFERFLNPLRPSAPDIDMDIADNKRDEVIAYLSQKYGKDKVCQIITFGTMQPRAAVRDVGRVLGVSYKKCDRLSKLIPTAPQGRKTTFSWAFETNPELKEAYNKDEESHRIIDIAQKLEGNYRHASVHAAGLYITPTKITDYSPIQWDSDHKMVISQYDWHIGEAVGLVKIDLLGIRNMSILGNAMELLKSRRNKEVDLFNLNTNDAKTFDLLSKGRTMGTFQLSSSGMTRWLVQLEPNRVEDLMAMVALYRPGPMANIPDYIKRKKDPSLISYMVPQMAEWMDKSYGVFVYQEDVILTAVKLAGYNFGEADNFRRALGKKKQKDLDIEKPKFFAGCKKNGIDEKKVEEIWDLIVPFSAYGFNKAHAGAYGLIAFWTAYMKAQYTVEFMTSLMSSESNDLEKTAQAIGECVQMGIEVLPPDVNSSFDGFSIENDKTIRYGLGSVKNLGSDVIKFIIQERTSGGNYQSLDDFLNRITGLKSFNKRSIEALIASGSLDNLGYKYFLEGGKS
jgi:DNA polymerase-3 subunit alpha